MVEMVSVKLQDKHHRCRHPTTTSMCRFAGFLSSLNIPWTVAAELASFDFVEETSGCRHRLFGPDISATVSRPMKGNFFGSPGNVFGSLGMSWFFGECLWFFVPRL